MSCQKYLVNPARHKMCLLQVYWRSRSHRLSWQGNEWAKPAGPFPGGSQKNDSQSHCFAEGKRGEVASAAAGVWGLGSHSSANMYSQDTVIQSILCLAATLTYRPNCQTGRPGHRGTRKKRLLPTPSFHFLSSLATADHPKTHAALLILTIKLEEGASSAPPGQLWSEPT